MDLLKEHFTFASSNIFDKRELRQVKKLVLTIIPQNQFVKNYIERNENKFDYCMVNSFGKLLKVKAPKLYEIVKKIKQDIMDTTGVHFKHAWHIMITNQGSNEQEWHCDNSKTRNYYTIIVPLTNDSVNQGGTEFKDNIYDTNGTTHSAYTPLNIYKGCLVFRGTVMHRGTKNDHPSPRIFMYIPLFVSSDPNEF